MTSKVNITDLNLTEDETVGVIKAIKFLESTGSVLELDNKLYKLNFNGNYKQNRYCNNSGSKDLIDHWAEVKDPIEFRAIMIGNIEKYCRRYGKKDNVIKEVEKIKDYASRLLEYEKSQL